MKINSFLEQQQNKWSLKIHQSSPCREMYLPIMSSPEKDDDLRSPPLMFFLRSAHAPYLRVYLSKK